MKKLFAAVAICALLFVPGQVRFAEAVPVRVVSPGTGVFLGNVVVARGNVTERSSNGTDIRVRSAGTTLFYSPEASLLFGLSIPYVDKKRSTDGMGEASVSGLGDVSAIGHWRFFNRMGRGYRDMAALRLVLELPTGETNRAVDLPLPEPARRALQPGSGALDTTLLLALGRAHYRYAAFANLSWRHNGEFKDLRGGDVAAFDLHGGAFLFPKRTRSLGFEVYAGLETRFEHRERTRFQGADLANSGGEVLTASPFLQLILGARALLETSIQFPVIDDTNGTQPDLDYSVLFGFRLIPGT
ncbi:MAG: hypothetical protein ACI8TX_002684 [Hyphomicrobiaceae bacterium]